MRCVYTLKRKPQRFVCVLIRTKRRKSWNKINIWSIWRNYIRLLRKRPQRSLTSSRSSTCRKVRSISFPIYTGNMRKKIDDVFGHTLGTAEKRSVATLIYYPREKLEQLRQSGEDMQNWYRVTLYRLIELCRVVSSKYTRSKVRKALPQDYAYVIEELITEKPELSDKEAYYEAIIQTILPDSRRVSLQ